MTESIATVSAADASSTSATTAPTTSNDAAWVSINTPLSVDELTVFCQDIERLMRINPFIEFSQWKRIEQNQFDVSGRNTSQDPAFEFDYRLSLESTEQGFSIDYSAGIKSNTVLKIEPAAQGSKLTIIDDYSGSSEIDQQQRIQQVDKSLIKWANEILVYILMWKRWSWLPPYRWYMRKVWQPLKPMSRRITYMLIWITAAELAFIALGFTIYWSEYT